MSDTEQIIRIAAKGDGVTATGRHVAHTAPGDAVAADGSVVRGPHHIEPPCRHFGKCGGCQLQHCDDQTLADFVRERVVNAASGQGLEAKHVAQPAMSPPHSRRRASLRAVNGGSRALLGFSQSGSHKLVGLRECHVLRPELFDAASVLRNYFSALKGRFSIGLELASTDQGIACQLSGFSPDGLTQTEELLDLCREVGFSRMSLDQGYGPEIFWEPEPVTVTFGKVPVAYPTGTFLQATKQGETALVSAAQEWLSECNAIADLFSGLGTFALSLAESRKVLAAEADMASILACKAAVAERRLQVETQHRDLFRNPLRAEELNRFDGLVLDPPRAGARAQVEQIAASDVGRVVYISCNPSSWSRDGAMLAAGGYDLVELRPVGQFRWSTHVELASLFVKRA